MQTARRRCRLACRRCHLHCCSGSTCAAPCHACSIHEIIGRGRQSKVYKARLKQSLEYVVVKACSKDLKARVLQEVRPLCSAWGPIRAYLVGLARIQAICSRLCTGLLCGWRCSFCFTHALVCLTAACSAAMHLRTNGRKHERGARKSACKGGNAAKQCLP